MDDIFGDWEKTAKEVYQDSLKVMKEGFHGLEVMASKTVEVGRIKLSNQKKLNQIRTMFMELGQRVYDAIVHQPKGKVHLTADIISFAKQIQKLHDEMEVNLEKLRHLTTVEKKKPARQAKKAAVKKKKKVKKK